MKNKNWPAKKIEQRVGARYVLYVRQAERRQDDNGLGIEEQKRALRRFAGNAGMSVVAERQDLGGAYRPKTRDGFNAMLDLLERGEADGILCVSIGHLARNHVDLARILRLRQRGMIQSVHALDGEYVEEDDFLLMVAFAVSRTYAAWKPKGTHRVQQPPKS